jgi:hypothetical protein
VTILALWKKAGALNSWLVPARSVKTKVTGTPALKTMGLGE